MNPLLPLGLGLSMDGTGPIVAIVSEKPGNRDFNAAQISIVTREPRRAEC